MIESNVNLKFIGFAVPHVVLCDSTQDYSVRNALPLSAVDDETLIKLCDQFKEDVLKKAREGRK